MRKIGSSNTEPERVISASGKLDAQRGLELADYLYFDEARRRRMKSEEVRLRVGCAMGLVTLVRNPSDALKDEHVLRFCRALDKDPRRAFGILGRPTPNDQVLERAQRKPGPQRVLAQDFFADVSRRSGGHRSLVVFTVPDDSRAFRRALTHSGVVELLKHPSGISLVLQVPVIVEAEDCAIGSCPRTSATGARGRRMVERALAGALAIYGELCRSIGGVDAHAVVRERVSIAVLNRARWADADLVDAFPLPPDRTEYSGVVVFDYRASADRQIRFVWRVPTNTEEALISELPNSSHHGEVDGDHFRDSIAAWEGGGPTGFAWSRCDPRAVWIPLSITHPPMRPD